MSYNEIITEITGTLEANGFKIVEKSKNYSSFKSESVELNIAFNERENSLNIFVGKKGASLSELSDDVFEFFGESPERLNIANAAPKLLAFLNGNGNAILKGNLDKLDSLEKYSLDKAEKYTNELVNRQNLNAADKAWQNNNYNDFLKFIDCLIDFDLPKSYILKKEIAQKKK